MTELQNKRKMYVPEGATKQQFDEFKAVVYLTELSAVGFSGRRGKPDFRYRFQSVERRDNYVNDWLEALKAKKQYQDAKRQFKHSLKVNDILYSSWGYEQTNIDFYQVVAVVSAKSVRVREIKSETVAYTSDMSSKVIAKPNDFCGEMMLKRVREGNYIDIESYASASPWDGTPLHQSSWH